MRTDSIDIFSCSAEYCGIFNFHASSSLVSVTEVNLEEHLFSLQCFKQWALQFNMYLLSIIYFTKSDIDYFQLFRS